MQFQVRALLEHVDVQGGVLDCCGAGQDAVSTVLTARGLRVATNDLSPRYAYVCLAASFEATTRGYAC